MLDLADREGNCPSIVGEEAHLSINVIRTAERWYVQRGDEAFAVMPTFPALRRFSAEV